MEDSSQVLEHGTGTPYVAIFNNLKEATEGVKPPK